MTSANIKTEYDAETRVLTVILTGELDHHSAYPLREDADRQLAVCRPKTLILDLSGIAFMDSSGLGYILGRYGKAQVIGATTEVIGVSDQIWRILKLAGVDKLIKIMRRK